MNKFVLVSVLLLVVTFSVSSQEISNHAIGIRFGDNDGFGGEISYQRQLSEENRFEVDLGYRNHKDYNAFK